MYAEMIHSKDFADCGLIRTTGSQIHYTIEGRIPLGECETRIEGEAAVRAAVAEGIPEDDMDLWRVAWDGDGYLLTLGTDLGIGGRL